MYKIEYFFELIKGAVKAGTYSGLSKEEIYAQAKVSINYSYY